ncbi:IgE-dependent histamine-releasing factor, partial [Trypanosoma rangeli]
MRIFKDALTNAEVFCDNDRPVEVEGDIVYMLKGSYIEVGGEDYGISANVDEDAGEGAVGDVDDSKKQVIDVVHNNRYTETNYDKNSYMAHIRSYMKQLLEK